MNGEISSSELKSILAQWDYDDDIMCEEDERTRSVKWALSQIPPADKVIFCLWLETGASRKVGKILGVSHSTVLKEIKRIKNNILTELEKWDS